ncbi:DUF4932 domain-containing protein [Pontibacter sp. CAU 1760]
MAYEVLGWYDDNSRTFTAPYIKAFKGQYSFEIPEVQELAHILFALTPTGKQDTNMVNHEGPYYQEVMSSFAAFEKDTLVQQLDALLQQGLYAQLKMDANAFYFKGDQIEQDSVYDKLSWSNLNHLEPFMPDLELFARQSNFRSFYKKHQPYYAQQIREMEAVISIRKQWQWLEQNFNNQYDHYRITFSPLVYGMHSTNSFVQPDFRQKVMFICGPIIDPQFEGALREGIMNMIVFTEIDHNYVNPVSDKYFAEIREALPELTAWATPEALSSYDNEYAVFNEYMTWAVYALYAKKHFKKKDFETVNTYMETMMAERRGFPKFREFNRELQARYKQRGKKGKLEALYPAMLTWCKNN